MYKVDFKRATVASFLVTDILPFIYVSSINIYDRGKMSDITNEATASV